MIAGGGGELCFFKENIIFKNIFALRRQNKLLNMSGTKSVVLLANRLKLSAILHPWSPAGSITSSYRQSPFISLPPQSVSSQYRFFSSDPGEVRFSFTSDKKNSGVISC